MKKYKWLFELIAFLTALLFIYTASSKLMEFAHFKKEIVNQAFPQSLDSVLIYGLPPIELLAALLLMMPAWRLTGFYLSAGLMLLFTAYVGLVTFHFYNRVPCSCAGVFHHMSWPQHLIFNIMFTVMCTAGILYYRWNKQVVSLIKT